ncbi:MAG: hypothetical protein GY699_07445 [Desulfobacteraceae bacterium]|nr:hypothetical protein [Desulfobacteraceae bacterium]
MKESFQSKIKRHIKSFPMLNFVARKFYAYPHLNIAAASNFRKLKSHLLEKKTEPRVLMVGGGAASWERQSFPLLLTWSWFGETSLTW